MSKRERAGGELPAESVDLEQQSVEEVLALKERALAASAEGITIADARLPDEPLIYVNAGFERLTGYTRREILGRNCRFLQGEEPPPDVRAELRRAIEERRECTVEIPNYRKDGTVFWNRLSITPVRDTAGEVTHFIGIQSDITGRKRAEEQLRRAKEALEVVNRRMKNDLESAALVQQTLLPRYLPREEGVGFAWVFEPCDELAGDTFGVTRLGADHLALYHLDVSGHGVSAALLSVTLSHWLAPGTERTEPGKPRAADDAEAGTASPAAVVRRLNRQFPMEPETCQFFTMFYGVLDTGTRSLRYVTAGHPPPVLLRSTGETQLLTDGGLPVGIVPQPSYDEGTVRLGPGDRLYLYSDGVTEARGAGEEEFGVDRLVQRIREARSESLQGSLDDVVRSVGDWQEGAQFSDDLSVLALEVEPGTVHESRRD